MQTTLRYIVSLLKVGKVRLHVFNCSTFRTVMLNLCSRCTKHNYEASSILINIVIYREKSDPAHRANNMELLATGYCIHHQACSKRRLHAYISIHDIACVVNLCYLQPLTVSRQKTWNNSLSGWLYCGFALNISFLVAMWWIGRLFPLKNSFNP